MNAVKRVIPIVMLCAGAIGVTAAQDPVKATDKATTEQLIALDQRMAAAASKNDVATLGKILASDYVSTDPAGQKVTRAKSLELAKGAHRGAIKNDDYSVRVIGNTAVMTHRSSEVVNDKADQSSVTHIWERKGATWQIVADQYTPIRTSIGGEVAGCKDASQEPEAFQFYGDGQQVFKKLEADQMSLASRRVYLVIVESAKGAELLMYEKNFGDDASARTYSWKGPSAGSLREQLASAILSNRGIACVGEMSKRTILASLHPASYDGVPAPGSIRGAFGHVVKRYANEYVRATVFVLC